MKFVSFGEIIWDVFDNTKTLGGAPLNVAGHMAKLGVNSKMISSVGNDELGSLALTLIKKHNIDDSEISLSTYPTGVANIELKEGIPSYDFNTPCAWDDIQLNDTNIDCDIFCFGSLSQRFDHKEKILKLILENINSKIKFFDVNIRKNYYKNSFILFGLEKCNIFKMNDDEVPLILNICNLNELDFEKAIELLMKNYSIDIVLITKGKYGIECYSRQGYVKQKAGNVVVVDTVGAGDSFSSGFLYCYNKTDDIKKSLKFGAMLADYVVSKQGAIPEYSNELKSKLNDIIIL